MKYLFFILLAFPVFSCKQSSLTGDIFIKNVNVVDIVTGKIIASRDVVIADNKITDILPHGESKVESKTIIDGTNKYLIPGLWDMHIHMMREEWYKSQMPLLRANGITGFREMWGDLKIATNVQSQIQKDSLPYFRFISSGHILDGKIPFWDNSISVATADTAVLIVDSLIKNKADFIKVYSYLEPDVFFAIAKRCKEKNIPFAGHVPNKVWLTSASDAGMASMEHLYGFLTEACSYADSAMTLRKQWVNAYEENNKEERKRLGLLLNSLVLNNFSSEKLKLIAKKLKKNNTYIVPTLVTLRGQYFSNDTIFTTDSRLKYMSKETLAYWKETTESDIKKNSFLDWENMRKRWQVEQQIMKILIAEGVTMMAGTDSDNPYAFPGFSLHDELALYVDFGMSPAGALQSATIIPARFLKQSDSLGSIEKGKLADLVLLDANPLENIKNTTKVNTVIANGKLYGKSYVDSVLKR